jgi:ArsR family transcriptional regulator
MDDSTARTPERLLGNLLSCLADGTRVRLLHALEQAELGVAELCDVLRLPQSTVSRHLKTLADAGFVSARADGTSRLYRSAPLDGTGRRLWRVTRQAAAGWPAIADDDHRLEARLAARRDEADRFFAGAAADWERLRAELYGSAFLGEVLSALLPPHLVVADLGCGTGDLAARLGRHVARVHAVDRSAAMLRAARRRVADLPAVTLHRADLEALPLDDASCDAALLVLVLAYVPDPRAVLGEAARVLRPGGRAVIVDVTAHADEAFRARLGHARPGLDAEDLADALATAGLGAPSLRALGADAAARAPPLLLATATRAAAPAPAPAPARAAAARRR